MCPLHEPLKRRDKKSPSQQLSPPPSATSSPPPSTTSSPPPPFAPRPASPGRGPCSSRVICALPTSTYSRRAGRRRPPSAHGLPSSLVRTSSASPRSSTCTSPSPTPTSTYSRALPASFLDLSLHVQVSGHRDARYL